MSAATQATIRSTSPEALIIKSSSAGREMTPATEQIWWMFAKRHLHTMVQSISWKSMTSRDFATSTVGTHVKT